MTDELLSSDRGNTFIFLRFSRYFLLSFITRSALFASPPERMQAAIYRGAFLSLAPSNNVCEHAGRTELPFNQTSRLSQSFVAVQHSLYHLVVVSGGFEQTPERRSSLVNEFNVHWIGPLAERETRSLRIP